MTAPPPEYIPFLFFWLTDFARYLLTDIVVLFTELTERRSRNATAVRDALIVRPDLPLVSVLMAGYNEVETIPATLASLAEQTYRNMEVVIVDDGSSDGTSAAVQAFLDGGGTRGIDCRLVTLRQRNGKAAALNLALGLARGSLIVYVDADTSFDRDSIAEIITPLLTDRTVGAVGGNIIVRNINVNILTRLVSLEYLFSISIGRRFRSEFNILHVISGAFGAFRRELLQAVGGHTPTSGNDGDLTLKIRRVAHRLVFAHRAVCMTNTPYRLKALIKQRRRWDRNLIKNKLRRHRDLLDMRSSRFKWSNAFLVLDAVFFNIILGLRWVLVFGATAIVAPESIPRALFFSYAIYVVGAAVQLRVARWLQPDRNSSGDPEWLYLPIYPLYKSLLRLVRLYAYFEETVRQASYADVFAPRAVSEAALAYDNSGRIPLRSLAAALLWPFKSSLRNHSRLDPIGEQYEA